MTLRWHACCEAIVGAFFKMTDIQFRQSLTKPVRATLLAADGDLASGPPPLFQGLTKLQRDHVLSYGRRIAVARGGTLFSEGTPHEGIYLIESGRMRVFYTAPSGREITLAYWYSGNFVGGPEVFGIGMHVWSGMATTASTVVLLPGQALQRLAQQIPALAMGIINGLVFKGRCYSALAQILGTRSVTQRLVQLLLHLAECYGIEEPGGTLIGAAFSHAELANMVGATRQWVTISMKRHVDAGMVAVRNGRIMLCRPDMLESMLHDDGQKIGTLP
jgi:CRP/FNR family cyclic AMP-dependent transcriptional regulator